MFPGETLVIQKCANQYSWNCGAISIYHCHFYLIFQTQTDVRPN